jgi:glycerophosphoryl diester phosphodiesterase
MSDPYRFSFATSGAHALPSARWVTIAHRGASGEHGDNTEAAFDAARIARVGIETDDRRTRNGVDVLAHERSVGGILIDESDYDEVHARNPHIVMTRWLLERCSLEDLLVIEVKYRDLTTEHGPIEISLLEELERVGRLEPQAAGRTAVSSFSPSSLWIFREHAPQLHRFQILEGLSDSRPLSMLVDLVCGLVRSYAIGIVPNVTDLRTIPWVQKAHSRALGVFPYPDSTIATREQHRKATALMIRSGCDGGHLNYPEMARELLHGDALPATEAMQRFLAWQAHAAAAFASYPAPTAATIGHLTARLVALGDGRNLSAADLRGALEEATARGDDAVVEKSRRLLAERGL